MDKGHYISRGHELSPEGLFAVGAEPFELNGTFYFPTTFFQLGTATMEHDDSKLVQLDMVTRSMLGNSIGVFMRMTPEGARELAGHLIANAQKVENHVAQQAAAAIEAARKGGA